MAKKTNDRMVVADLTGWVLICPDDEANEWHIAWLEPFGSKKAALDFAARHSWPKPYRAARGRIMIDPQ